MVEKARALTKDDGSVYGIVPVWKISLSSITRFMVTGYIVNEDKTECGWDKPEAQQGIQDWVSLIEEGLSPDQASMEETNPADQFAAGRLAMCWAGSWRLPIFAESDVADDIDLVELPDMPEGKATVIHGVGHAINNNTEVPELAEAFVKFLSGTESAQFSAETGAAIPSYAGMADAWKENYPQYNLQAYLTAAEEYSYPYPASANTAEGLTTRVTG